MIKPDTGAAAPRHPAKRLAIYNHKGGVGKTTLTINLGAALAERGLRVLLIDSDPQCNLTSYLVEESVVDDLLDKSETDEGRTVWTALKPIDEGSVAIRVVEPYETKTDGLFYLPGDLFLSTFEVHLATSWAETYARRMRGYNEVTALSQLVNELAGRLKADFVLYDSGPNVGPLNRVIMLDCDFFIIPAACDLFSLRALKTLGLTLERWIKDWKTIKTLAPDDIYLLHGEPRFLGYIAQRFRVYGGKVTQAYREFLPRLEKSIQTEIVARLNRIDPTLVPERLRSLRLGEIKDFASLAIASQSQGVPLWDVKGGRVSEKKGALSAFRALADNVIAQIGAPSET